MPIAMQDGMVAHILDLLQDWGGVSARRMFGGHGLYRDGAMFGLLARETLYLRVDARNRPDFLAAGAQPFRYRRGDKGEVEIQAYMECPPDLLEEEGALVRWAEQALEAARAAKPKTKRRAAKD
jgi:DNA transformation protein